MVVPELDRSRDAKTPGSPTPKGTLSMLNQSTTSFVLGDPRLTRRFWEKVQPQENGCWLWLGTRWKGYGIFWGGPKGRIRAHRFAYQSLVEPIPDGLQIDHLCRNRACVRPAHMEVVTNRENVLRGIGLAAQNAAKTHCSRGHPYDLQNTRVYNGHRRCRACGRARAKRLYWEAKEGE